MQIGFIDFSTDERNKILATLKLLGTQTALDELGIGTIRDAYADILFPGISTIQTRAKYFVVIPYLFELAGPQDFSNGRELYRWLVETEDQLVETFVRNSDREEKGIIGKNALKQKRTVKMKPSSIYWNGLRTYEILRDPRISLSAACNIAWSSTRGKHALDIKIDGDTFDDSSAGKGHTILFSPIKPEKNFKKTASITLTQKEATFLSERITQAKLSKNTLLAFLIQNKYSFTSFNEIASDLLPIEMRREYVLAKDFSDFIIGAHIRYNIIFSNYKDEEMMNAFTSWEKGFINRDFNLELILERISCPNLVAKFCENFMECVYRRDYKMMDELIIAREKAVKLDRAKLCKPKEYRYNYDRPIHYYRLDYRFGTAKIIIDDIINGLKG